MSASDVAIQPVEAVAVQKEATSDATAVDFAVKQTEQVVHSLLKKRSKSKQQMPPPTSNSNGTERTTTKDECSDDDDDAARYMRFCAFLKPIVPDQALYPKLYSLPSTFFEPDQLPFEQKCFMTRFNSIVVPYLGCIFTIVGSTATLMLLVARHTRGLEREAVAMGAIFLPLALGMLAMAFIFEMPCRLMIYYRLWEQKLVIDYKSRGIDVPSTQLKLGLFVVSIGCYMVHGLQTEASGSYYLYVIQSFGAIACAIYQSLNIEGSLLPFNSAIRRTKANEENSSTPSKVHFSDAIAQINFIDERAVKYDMIALDRAKRALARKRQRQHTTDPTSDGALIEQREWLQQLALWIGRLGNTKESLGNDISLLEHEFYAFRFLKDGVLYDDQLWQRTGSFRQFASCTGCIDADVLVLLTLLLAALIDGGCCIALYLDD